MRSFLFAMLLSGPFAMAQEFNIKEVELTADGVVLHYDLVDTTKNRFYTVHVFSSRDNFLNPLSKLKGDVGLEVRPGTGKKVMWDPKELGAQFRGDVELEVRGKVYIPFVRFTNLKDYKAIKRTKPTTLSWTGGTRQNILNFNLYRGDELITVIPNVANSGSYDLVLPRSVKPGSGYYFIVGDTKNKDMMMKTSEFTVKPKIPLLLKILPILGTGFLVYELLPKPGPDVLDDPFLPPEGKN